MIGLLGFPAMVVVGVVLGMIGAGGSILVVPILVYLFAVPASLATGYSLLIVGVTALAGAVTYLRRGQSDKHMAVVFGLPAIVAVYLTRRILFPAIPDPVFEAGAFVLGKDRSVMILFACFMLVAAVSMMRSGGKAEGPKPSSSAHRNVPLIVAIGLMVGVFTGLVGAGGGFMILPALVLLGGLPMKVAIGTDLIIIAAKSLLGFVGEMQAVEGIDYGFLVLISVLPLLGMSIGTYLNRRTPAPMLKTAFGWFVLVMGCVIVVQEMLFG